MAIPSMMTQDQMPLRKCFPLTGSTRSSSSSSPFFDEEEESGLGNTGRREERERRIKRNKQEDDERDGERENKQEDYVEQGGNNSSSSSFSGGTNDKNTKSSTFSSSQRTKNPRNKILELIQYPKTPPFYSGKYTGVTNKTTSNSTTILRLAFWLALLLYSIINTGTIFVNAFDIVAVSHKEQVVTTNLANICPCDDEKLPCYDANAPDGAECAAPLLTDSEVSQRLANGDPAARCGTFVDCIELVAISANQQRSLVPKQLLERSRLGQFHDEQAPVFDKYGTLITRGNTIPYSRWTYIGCFSAQVTDVTADATAPDGQQA